MKNKYLFLLFVFSLNCIASNAAIKENRHLEVFNKINASDGIDVYFIQGDEQSVVVEADETVIKNLVTEVKNNILVIKWKGAKLKNAKKASVFVYAPVIEDIVISSGSNFYCDNFISEGSLAIAASSGSTIRLGEIRIADFVEITISSGSNCHIKHLQSSTCRLDASSGSNIQLNINTSDLSVTASSGSNIELSGRADDVTIAASSGSNVYAMKLNYNKIDVAKSGGSNVHAIIPN